MTPNRPNPTPAPRRLQLPRGAALELAAVVALVGLGLYHWPGLTGAPTPQDHLLDGMDAGEWADQARAYAGGRYAALDGHRMPTWTILAGLVGNIGVPEAGHLMNHLLQVALAPIVYGLGRAWGMGRGTSLLAGAVVAANAVLVLASRRYGVDPTVTTLVPLCLLAAHLVRLRWWLGPVAGGVAALATASHFTTLPYPVPAALTVLLVARPAERFPALLSFLAGLSLAWGAIFLVFPWIGVNTLLLSVAESASHEAAGVPGTPGWERILGAAVVAVRQDLPGAAAEYASRMHAVAPPALVTFLLAGLGATGVGLGAAHTGRRARRNRGVPEPTGPAPWAAGVVLLSALAPVPVLLAMHAAPRYSDNLLPIAILLVVRGVAAAATLIDGALPRSWPRALAGRSDAILGVISSFWAVAATAPGIPTASLEGAVVDQEVGALLAEHAPPGSCVVSPMRDAVAYTDLRFVRLACPASPTEPAFRACLSGLAWQCPDQTTLTWLVLERTPLDERTVAKKAMDEWARRSYPVLGEHRTRTTHVSLIELPFEVEAPP
ncbi:hypothetical protein LBMAG42_41680 [Deltaproteobacteria bacterium]|nr:hypothetical protein LBMAG42_41680 [Deltaproteobacteria bacterium]